MLLSVMCTPAPLHPSAVAGIVAEMWPGWKTYHMGVVGNKAICSLLAVNFNGISYIQAQLDSLAVVALGKDTKGADAVHKCLQATTILRKDNSFCDILLVGFMLHDC